MAEESFPVVEQPMTAEQWKHVTRGIGDGILDEGGFPYHLTGFSNSNNTATLRVSTSTGEAAAIVAGHYHKMDSDMTLEFPAVTSRTTYYVMLQYDPLDDETPVKVVVSTSIDASQGKVNLHLWNVTRNANELLTDAVVRNIRPRVATTATYASMADLPQAHKVLWGSVAFIHGGRASDNATIMMSMNDSSGNWYWKTIYDPNADDFTYEWANRSDTGTYISPSHGYNRAIGRRGKRRKFRGRVARANGSTFNPGNTYQIWSGDLPASDRPGETQRFVTVCGNDTPTFATIEVSATGSITARVSAKTYWIGFDGIEWEVK